MKTLPLFLIAALLIVDVFSRDKQDNKKDDSKEEKDVKYGTIIGIDLGTTYRLLNLFF